MALGAAAVIASVLIFDSRVGAGFQKDALAFAIFPLVLWGATRFEIPGAAGVTLVIASIAVWETGAGHGLFLQNTTLQNAAMLQAFLAVISVSGLVLAVVIGLVVWWGLNRTRQGKIVLAVIHSAEVASSMGVNVSRVYALAFSVGIFLAAIGGAFTAPMISVQPGLSVSVIVVSFAVVIIGGLGSIEGAAIGALVVGLARAASVHLAPDFELFSIYLVMAGVLIFRPEGLFQSVKARLI